MRKEEARQCTQVRSTHGANTSVVAAVTHKHGPQPIPLVLPPHHTLGSKFPGLQPCTKAESKLQGSLPVQCAEGRCPLLGYVAINCVG